MNIFDIYKIHHDKINLIKDLIFFAGAYKLYEFLKNKKLQYTSNKIIRDIEFRDNIEPQLSKYINEENGKAIRFVHWKNYLNLENDGFKFFLRINYLDDKPYYGWIDNNGLNFEERFYFDKSVYIDKNNIFFIDKKNLIFRNFKELRCVFILHLPFSNIINYDFLEKIEYEPVFYLKYYYNNWKKLYDDKIVIKAIDGEDWLMLELSQKKMLKKYSFLKYSLIKIKVIFLNFFN
jgi:hypothetical protein